MTKNNAELLNQVKQMPTEVCVECNSAMVTSTADWDLPLDLFGRKHTLVITDIPTMRCKYGQITHNLDLLIRVEELVDRLVLDALRYQKHVPERLSIIELFK